MIRREFIAAVGTGAAGLLAGCASIAGEEPADADVHVEELAVERIERNTIRVTGSGSVETEPDEARFSVSVVAHDSDDASAVVEALADRAESVRDALVEYGIPEENVTTERYSLRENSRRNRYEGEHRYAVEVDDPDAVGEVIDVCVDAGADSIGRISFTISEERREELYDEAVERRSRTPAPKRSYTPKPPARRSVSRRRSRRLRRDTRRFDRNTTWQLQKTLTGRRRRRSTRGRSQSLRR